MSQHLRHSHQQLLLSFCYTNVWLPFCLTIRCCKFSLIDDLTEVYMTCYSCFHTAQEVPLSVLVLAVLSIMGCGTPVSSKFQLCDLSSMLASCARWIAIVLWQSSPWGNALEKHIDISAPWSKGQSQTPMTTLSTTWHSKNLPVLFYHDIIHGVRTEMMIHRLTIRGQFYFSDDIMQRFWF